MDIKYVEMLRTIGNEVWAVVIHYIDGRKQIVTTINSR
jgi:hypothetical protein